eukprot:m51a1_g12330 putative 2-nitropropane dioxygenase (5051) ;mRNA; r:463581-479334
MLEGHGTGTPVGDVIELMSHSRVFDSAGAPRESIALGSIKSNIGHLKAVAGFAGITLPASINCRKPPKLQDGRELNETSLFGFGGANYHCVVEEFEAEQEKPYRVNPCPVPVLLSAPTVAELASLVRNEAAALLTVVKDTGNLDTKEKKMSAQWAAEGFRVRFALNGSPESSHPRVGFLAGDLKSIVATLEAISKKLSSTTTEDTWTLAQNQSAMYSVFRAQSLVSGSSEVAALFVGQGATYPYMFDEVAMNWPPFRKCIASMDAVREREGQAPISSLLYPRAPYKGEPEIDPKALASTLNAQPATIATTMGAYDVFTNAGFAPGFVAGHSLGELAALSVGGAFDRKTLFELVVQRAKAMNTDAEDQAMAAVVGAGAAEVRCEQQDVWVANSNSPDQVVLSGRADSVRAESQRLQQKGFKVFPLSVSGAFHTSFMKPAADRFADAISHFDLPALQQSSGPRVFSNAVGSEYPKDRTVAEQLAEHIVSPLKFMDEVLAMYSQGARVFVEFGPGKALSGMVNNTLKGHKDVLAVSVNPNKTSDSEVQMREAAVALAVAGVPLHDFDPWVLPLPPMPAETEAARRKRLNMTFKLSATTYATKSTIEERNRIINDGYRVKSGPAPAPSKSLRAVSGPVHAKAVAIPSSWKDFPMPPKNLLVWGNGSETFGKMTWHPLAGVNGNPTPNFRPTEFPPRAIKFIPFPGNPNDTNHVPGEYPLSWYNLAEFSCGKMSLCFGDEFKWFDGFNSSRMPSFDLQLLTRVLSGSERGVAVGATACGEFDCPSDAWFYQGRADTYMPYSILMEIALQLTAVITSWSQVPQSLGCKKLLYRNLDATASLLRDVDCRGKTILIKCKCTGSSLLGKTAIQKFNTELMVDGSTFYVVDSSFGWFDSDVFLRQVGLDNGALFTPWVFDGQNRSAASRAVSYDLPAQRTRLFSSPVRQSLARHSEQLNLLDRMTFVENAGVHGKGYAYGHKSVDPHDWFFSCHFWCDPVMPGSLGVESMFQLVEAACVHLGVPESLGGSKIRWVHDLGVTKWKYRGQLVPTAKEMEIEIHIKSVDIAPGSHALVVADGFLMGDKLRIYAVTDIRLRLACDSKSISPVAQVAKSKPRSDVPAVVKSPQPSGRSPGGAQNLVLDTLVKATGYDRDLIELDMDLEQELGIDSIKRVEILSLVQAHLGDAAKDNQKLLAVRTVRDVIDAISAFVEEPELIPSPKPSGSGTPPSRRSEAPGMGHDAASDMVLDTLAKATGYDKELIDLDMDLEQELGIDSIKRVEILSTVQSKIGVAITDSAKESLASSKTVRQVISAITGLGGDIPSPKQVVCQPIATRRDSAAASDLVLDTLAKATGYDKDLIDVDMDLEQELGIDSIKRVEILSTVQSKIGVSIGDSAKESLASAKTVRQVIDAVGGYQSEAVLTATVEPKVTVREISAPHVDSTESASDLVLSTLAKATGYDRELIDLDMDLEQELGIDSIKRVEILSMVQAKLGVDAKENQALVSARTVRQVIDAIASHPVSSSSQDLVLETLSKATGYDKELIDMDMDMEQELGIDSIKKVEILSLVQSKLGVSAKDNHALATARTVRAVIDAVAEELPTTTSRPAQEIKSTAGPSPAGSAMDTEAATQLVLGTLSKATGYEQGLIEPDMDLEQELGIDSIKRVEILSTVQSALGVDMKENQALLSARTVGQVIAAISQQAAAGIPKPQTAAGTSPSKGMTDAEASELVLSTLSKATGYEPGLIDLDMDLEQELGIDSIKKVEILSLVQSKLGVSAQDNHGLSTARTVRAVIDAIVQSSVAGGPAAEASPSQGVVEVNEDAVAPSEAAPVQIAEETDAVDQACAVVKEVNVSDRLEMTWPRDRAVIVVDNGSALTATLASKLAETFHNVVVLTFPNEPRPAELTFETSVAVADRSEPAIVEAFKCIQDRHGVPGGFVYQHNPTADAATQLQWVLLAAKHLSKPLHVTASSMRPFFLCLVRLDGQLGLGFPKSPVSVDGVMSAEQGAVFGLCKTLSIEWQSEVLTRAVDICPDVSDDQAAECLVRETACADLTLREVGYTSPSRRWTIAADSRPDDRSSAAPADSMFTKESAVLVSGGARGITPLCVAALVQRIGGGTFFLLGRSSLEPEATWSTGKEGQELREAATAWLKQQAESGGPQPSLKAQRSLVERVEAAREIRSSIACIESFGGRAHFIKCDVTDVSSVHSAVDEAASLCGAPITGIFHASGVVRDKRVENKTTEDFAAVYGVKLTGLRNLLTAFEEKFGLAQLKQLVVYSSLAGYFGNGGQSDYSMANDALSKVAQRIAKALPHCATRSLCFGPWDGGMVTPVLKAHFKSHGIQIIPREGGAQQVARILSRPHGGNQDVQWLMGNWKTAPVSPRKHALAVGINLERPVTEGDRNAVLLSHVIQGRVVVPMTAAIGLLAIHALRTHPGWHLHATEQSYFYRSLSWGADDLAPLDCQIKISPPAPVDGRKDLISVDTVLCLRSAGKLMPAFKSSIVLGQSELQSPRVRSEQTGASGECLSSDDIYGEGKSLFHGPLLQGIESVSGINEKGLVALCRHIPLSTCEQGQFARPDTGMTSDPFVMDVAFQAILVWAHSRFGQASLPQSAGRVEFYPPGVGAGDKYTVVLRVSRVVGQTVEADAVMTNERGQVFCRALGFSVTMSKSLSYFASAKAAATAANPEQPLRVRTQTGVDARVAIVGMAVRLPGARNADEYWQMLVDNREAAAPIDPKALRTADKSVHTGSGTITNDSYNLLDDAAPTSEHELLVDVAAAALADARARGVQSPESRCGVVNGSLSFPGKDAQDAFVTQLYVPHFERVMHDQLDSAPQREWGSYDSVSPRTIHTCDPASYAQQKLSLAGGCPAYSIDAACATALYATKLARDHLLAGDADVMLCSATSVSDPFYILKGFSICQVLPGADGKSAPLASGSGGLQPGEGAAALVLMRLADAVKAGVKIHGVLVDVGVSNAGAGLPFRPTEQSELRCLRETYADAKVDPKSVQYVECHATGTAVGDSTELHTVESFWGARSIPLLGSVKANIGHTLTVAGFASIAKELLGMRAGVIPATPKVRGTAISAGVVVENASWPETAGGAPRRAGVSAFGFGGTLAHAIVEEYKAQGTDSDVAPVPLVAEKKPTRVAIVGMEARFGTLRGLAEFERAMYHGADAACALPEKRWRSFADDPAFASEVVDFEGRDAAASGRSAIRGCFVDKIDADYRRLALPMLPEDQLKPNHLLALSVIDAALEDALGLVRKGTGARVAVLVGMGADPELYRERARHALHERLGDSAGVRHAVEAVAETLTTTSMTSTIGNILATRIASVWGFTGPAFSVAEGSCAVYRCAELAASMLARGEIDAAVVAGVDMSGSAEGVWHKVRHCGFAKMRASREHPSAAFSLGADEALFVGEGAGALVLMRADDVAASKAPARVYATIDAVASASTAESGAMRALQSAGLEASAVGQLELSAAHTDACEAELRELSAVYKSGAAPLSRSVAVGSVLANVGHCGYASGAAALIKSALCLHNRYVAPVPRYGGPRDVVAGSLRDSSFYVVREARAWVSNAGSTRRVAVSGAPDSASLGSWYHVVMSEFSCAEQSAVACHEEHCLRSVEPGAPVVVAFRGQTTSAVASGVRQSLQRVQTVGADNELRTLVSRTLSDEGSDGLALAVVATAHTLEQELKLALAGVEGVTEANPAWKSPAGSCFTMAPVRSDRIAFVYGDTMAPYTGVGHDLLRIAPQLHSFLAGLIPNAVGSMSWQHKSVDVDDEPVPIVQLMCSGVCYSVLFTALVQEVLGLRPRAALGLSLGETSIAHVFSRHNAALSAGLPELLTSGSVFLSDLAGDLNAVRTAWSIPADAPVSSFWQGYMVAGTREAFEAAAASNPSCRARLTIVHSPTKLIVAGVPSECEKVFAAMGASFTPVPGVRFAGHCPETLPCAEQIDQVHRHMQLPQAEGVELFTALEDAPIGTAASTVTSVGQMVRRLLAGTIDFAALVRRVYAAGYRVFVEAGPQNLRSLAIDDTLGAEPHVSVAVDRKGDDQWRAVCRAVAQLLAHRTPGLTLRRLYHPRLTERRAAPRSASLRSVEVNGRFPGRIAVQSAIDREVEFQLRRTAEYKGPVVFDYNDLLEFAEGNVAPVFNKRPSGTHEPWEAVDGFSRRVRLPMRDYLLVSRVTHMSATTGVYARSTMRTEYDLPVGGHLSEGGDVPCCVLVESGQCDLMLISYLGIDLQCRGERVYRLLDTTLTFHGVAREGQTLCYDISLDSFARTGDRVSMMFFSYNCYLLIEMRNGVAGFFTDEELAAGKGITHSEAEVRERQSAPKQDVSRWLSRAAVDRTSISRAEMASLCADGSWAALLPAAQGVQRKLCCPKTLMIDEVLSIDPRGGAHGLGRLVGEKRIARDDWFFPCHFKGDQVMAGSLVSEGCFQLLKVFTAWLGLPAAVDGPQFRPMRGRPGKVRCRGQIQPHRGKLVYVMEVREIGVDAATGFPYAVADFDIVDVNEELGNVYAGGDSWGIAPSEGRVVVDFRGLAIWVEGARRPGVAAAPQTPAAAAAVPVVDGPRVAEALLDVDAPCAVPAVDGGEAVSVPSVSPRSFGSRSFLATYGVDYPLYLGAMAKGIASADMVIAAGSRRMLASFGAGGLSLESVDRGLDKIQRALPGGPYAVNLIHSPYNSQLESGCVDIFLRRGVRNVEASAFMSLTPAIVRYRVAGLRRGADGSVACDNHVLFKISRSEMAELAMRPAPRAIVDALVAEGAVTAEQAEMAACVPMADDVVVEGDSGGHTDNRPLSVIFPVIKSLAARIGAEMKYRTPLRVGAGGGIGCPEAAAAAFRMGAAFVVTGTINQVSRQSGTCDPVRQMLSAASFADVAMAPAADMFDQGVQVQVLKGAGTMFTMRAKKLYSLYTTYNSLEDIPQAELSKLEKTVFKKTVAHIWAKTRLFLERRGETRKVAQAEANPKLKMSLVFCWYLGKSSRWASLGKKNRSTDFQIWCGPAIGSYNAWVKGSLLDPAVAGAFPCVVQQNLHILRGVCYLERLAMLKQQERAAVDVDTLPGYVPTLVL